MQMMHAVVQAAKVQGVVFIDIYIYITGVYIYENHGICKTKTTQRQEYP